MANIPTEVIREFHLMFSSGAVIALLSVPEEEIYLARNNEDVVWNGITWQRFYFELGIVNLNSEGKLPQMVVDIENVMRVPEYWIEQYNGFTGKTANFYLVHSNKLDVSTPYFSLSFQIQKATSTREKVSFSLGIDNPMTDVFPQRRSNPYICSYVEFKGELCGYTGTAYTTCDRRYESCVQRGNTDRFGGTPGTIGATFVE